MPCSWLLIMQAVGLLKIGYFNNVYTIVVEQLEYMQENQRSIGFP